MYVLPPSTIVDTVGLIAGTSSVTVLPAPGVGFRYRIVAATMMLVRNVAAGVYVDCSLTSGAVSIAQARALNVNGQPTHYQVFPEPGIQCDDNAAVVFSATATAAGSSAAVMLYYFLDAVS